MTQWLEAIIFKCRFEATDLRREAHLELDCSRLLSLASASVFTVGSNYRNPPQMRFLKKYREIDSGHCVCSSLTNFLNTRPETEIKRIDLLKFAWEKLVKSHQVNSIFVAGFS